MKPPPPVSSGSDKTTVGVVLLSLFGYPGGGHFLLKHPTRGGLWAAGFTLTMVAALSAFFMNLYRLYRSVTTLAEPVSLSAQEWMPCVVGIVACGIVWVLAALDAAWISRLPSADEPSTATSEFENS